MEKSYAEDDDIDDVWFHFVDCIFTNNEFNQVLISMSNANTELSPCYIFNRAYREMNLIDVSSTFLLLMNKIKFYGNIFGTIININSYSVITVSLAELKFLHNIAYRYNII